MLQEQTYSRIPETSKKNKRYPGRGKLKIPLVC